jgi:hypothetical protein
MFGRTLLPLHLTPAISTTRVWGNQGRQVIANVAYARLTTKARAEVDHLRALEPGATRGSISTWAE